jgi:fucose permease
MKITKPGRIVVAAMLVIFAYGTISAMLGALMPTFHLTVKQNSEVALAQAIGLIMASLSTGPLIDKRGKKTALIAGFVLISATLYTLPNAVGYAQIALCFLVLGFGGGLVGTAANVLASDIDEKRRGSALNFLNLFFGLGLMAAPFIAANLLNGSATALCYFEAALATVTLLILVVTPIPPAPSERAFTISEARQVLHRPELWLLSLSLFLYVACEVGVSNWLATYLITRGIPRITALNILSLGFALGLLVGRVAVSGILLKVSAPAVTLGSAGLLAVTTYLVLQTTDPNVAGIVVFCAGLAMAPVFPTTLAMIADAFPVMTATAMGIAITSGWLGLAVSSPVIGAIAGSDSRNLGTALLIFPIASLIMIVINLAVRPMLRR